MGGFWGALSFDDQKTTNKEALLCEAYGMRMGPLRMWDLVGLDLFGREREKSGEAQA